MSDHLQLLPLAEIEPKPIEFLWRPFIQKNGVHQLAGMKNAGKGTLLAYITAKFTRGECGEKRRVLWIALGEDSYEIDVRPRCELAGAVVDQVHVVKANAERGFTLPGDVAFIEQSAEELGGLGLVIIDPISGALGGKSSNHDYEVRPALVALNQMAERIETAVIASRHLSNKHKAQQDGALSALLGTSDWANVPRAVLALVHDDIDPNLRHLHVVTGNRTPANTPGLEFSIEGRVPAHGGEEVTVARLVGDSTRHPDELLATKREPTRTAEARRVLLQLLAEADAMRMPSQELDEIVAAQADIASRTVENIRKSLRRDGLVRAEVERTDGKAARWFAILTEEGLRAHEAEQEAPTNPDTTQRASRASRASGGPDALGALDAQEAPYPGSLTAIEHEVINAIGEHFPDAWLVKTTPDDVAGLDAIRRCDRARGGSRSARDDPEEEPNEALTASALFDADDYREET